MKCTLSSHIYYSYTLLAAGFCEQWPKACALGLRWLRPAAFDCGKKLAANEQSYILVLAQMH